MGSDNDEWVDKDECGPLYDFWYELVGANRTCIDMPKEEADLIRAFVRRCGGKPPAPKKES